MTLLIEKLAEQRIQEAIENGTFDDLPGRGQPLIIDDDSDVPENLRMGYRVLKNAGFLPPELQQRKDALTLCDLIKQSDQDSQEMNDAIQRLQHLEQRMNLKGLDTRFIQRYWLELHEQCSDKEQ
ncbi:MAG: DnaJ family domain-containing protein [Vibrio sp.]